MSRALICRIPFLSTLETKPIAPPERLQVSQLVFSLCILLAFVYWLCLLNLFEFVSGSPGSCMTATELFPGELVSAMLNFLFLNHCQGTSCIHITGAVKQNRCSYVFTQTTDEPSDKEGIIECGVVEQNTMCQPLEFLLTL